MPAFRSPIDFVLFDQTDYTKRCIFDLSAITTANQRRYTVPDADGTLALTDVDLTEIAAVANVRGDLLVTNGAPSWDRLAIGAANKVLRTNGIDPSWGSLDLSTDVTGVLAVGFGGTGLSTLAAGSLVYGNVTTLIALAIGASGSILTSSGSAPQWSTNAAVVDIARTWATLQTFKDTTWKIVDDADASKTAVFSLGGASANADLTLAWAGTLDRTWTFPDVTGTGLTTNVAQTVSAKHVLTGVPRFEAAAAGTVLDLRDTTLGGVTSIAHVAAANQTLTIPSVGTDSFAFIAALQTFTNKTLGSSNTLDTCDTRRTQFGTLIPVGNAADPGAANNRMSKVDRTAQAAVIGSHAAPIVLAQNAAPGMYRISYWLACTTLDATAGSIRIEFDWSDVVGATTFQSDTLTLIATGRIHPQSSVAPTTFNFQLQSTGNITWHVDLVAGAVNAARFAVYVRCEYLG